MWWLSLGSGIKATPLFLLDGIASRCCDAGRYDYNDYAAVVYKDPGWKTLILVGIASICYRLQILPSFDMVVCAYKAEMFSPASWYTFSVVRSLPGIGSFLLVRSIANLGFRTR